MSKIVKPVNPADVFEDKIKQKTTNQHDKRHLNKSHSDESATKKWLYFSRLYIFIFEMLQQASSACFE